jgi:hypothetical protein
MTDCSPVIRQKPEISPFGITEFLDLFTTQYLNFAKNGSISVLRWKGARTPHHLFEKPQDSLNAAFLYKCHILLHYIILEHTKNPEEDKWQQNTETRIE